MELRLFGPSYHQADQQNCRLWCDPRNGSHKTFLKALHELAGQSQHAELDGVPWCLWGHSGGAFWSSLMQTMYPERIVAIWFRSGTAFAVWEKGEIPKPEISEAVYRIPAMCNPGGKEKDDPRFASAWTGALAMFQAYRAHGAPIGLAPDPRTAHECGDSRYLAIPYFDACLDLRLPAPGSNTQKLRDVDSRKSWLAPLLGEQAVPAESFHGNASEAVWLPSQRIAKAWEEYVKVGSVSDATPPPAPRSVRVGAAAEGGVEITWDAEVDFESGLRGFVVQRDAQELGQVPEAAAGKFGRPLFQGLSYHDTPEKPLPAMRFVDRSAGADVGRSYRVIAINSDDLRSEPSAAATPR